MKDWIGHFREATCGLPVSHVWRGYGSALFLELGFLTPSTIRRRDGTTGEPSGEIGLMLECDWRIEHERSIVCGSGSDEALWQPAFDQILGRTATDLTAVGRLPELLLSLTDDFHIASFMTDEGDPEWSLFDRRASELITVHCRSGIIREE